MTLSHLNGAVRAWAQIERGLALGVLALFLIVSLNRPASAMNIQEVTSPGGIKAWLVEQHTVPLIAMRFSFSGGNSQDPNGKEGVLNFLTAMMDEGAGDIKSSDFQDQVEDVAMKMSFEDDRDYLFGTFQTLTENRAKSVALLKLALTKPRFDADATARIRGQLLAGLAFAAKDPNKIAGEAFVKAAFPNHPYGRPTSGSIASVTSITPADLHAIHARIFARDTLKVAVVGDIDVKALGEMLDQVFGDLPAKGNLMPVAAIKAHTTGQVEVVSLPVPQSVAIFGLPGLARKDPDFITAFVLNHILGGGGFTSRLMTEVREKRGLAYSVYSYLQTFKESALFAGGVATKNEEIGRSLEVIRAELKRMATDGPTAEELANAKSYLTGSYALRFDTSNKIAAQLLGIQIEDLGKGYIDSRNQQIEAVTLADVKRVAQSLFKYDSLLVTVVGQPKGLVSKTGG